MSKPTVVIADDNFLIREGCIQPTLAADFDIVASVDDGRAAVAAVAEHRPDVVLLDISLPVMKGFDAARRILSAQPEVKVLFVSNYAEKAFVNEAKDMLASGYVLKSRAAMSLYQRSRLLFVGSSILDFKHSSLRRRVANSSFLANRLGNY